MLAAVEPFHHLRSMQLTLGWYTSCPFTSPDVSSIGWENRTLISDAIWAQPGYVRPGAFGAPWETVVRLSQQTGGKGIWINIPVQATDAYVDRLALLLLNGSPDTGGQGLAPGTPLYVEHGNELWLNGSAAAGGGPSLTYLWNKAAAVYEVEHNASSDLNDDGVNDPELWASRRHVRRVWQIGALLSNASGGGLTVRPVLDGPSSSPMRAERR